MPSRGPRTTSTKRAKEVADRYFDLDATADRLLEDETFELDGRRTRPSTRTPKYPTPAPAREPDPPITDKQARFIEEYCVDWNGTAAAIRAGYSEKQAASQAYENLRKPHIARAIEARRKVLADRADWDAMAVMRRLAAELNADLADLFDEHTGALKPIHDWPLIWRQGGVLVGVDIEGKVDIGTDPDGEMEMSNGRVVKVRIANRTKQLELLGKLAMIQAFNHNKPPTDEPKVTPLQELSRQLNGTGLRPREIEGTARPVNGQ